MRPSSLLSACLLASLPSAQVVQFELSLVPVGDVPRGIATADLDGDGDLDLVVANSGSARVGVLPGFGDGSFGPMKPYNVGPDPRRVAIGDVDGDGDLDLVGMSRAADSARVLHGDGALGFVTGADVALGIQPIHVALADIDQDGKADLLAASEGSEDFAVHPGAGDGTFIDHVHAAKTILDNRPTHFAVADLNADGDLDVAVASLIGTSFDAGRILVGSGPLTFDEKPFPFSFGYEAYWVALGDIDGDGDLDLANPEDDGLENCLVVWNATGDGTSYSVVWNLLGHDQFRPTFGDLNGDGHTDLVTSPNTGISYLSGDGSFAFTVEPGFDPPGSEDDVQLADLDGDGLVDVLASLPDSDEVSVALSRTCPVQLANLGVSPTSVPVVGVEQPLVEVTGTSFCGFQELRVAGFPVPANDVELVSDTLLRFRLPYAPLLGTVSLEVDADGVTAATTFELVPPPTPVLTLKPGDGFSQASGLAPIFGSAPGDLIFFVASGDLSPSLLPGIASFDVGAGFSTLVLVATYVGSPWGWFQLQFQLGSLAVGAPLHLQLGVYEAATGSFPLVPSNVLSGTVTAF